MEPSEVSGTINSVEKEQILNPATPAAAEATAVSSEEVINPAEAPATPVEQTVAAAEQVAHEAVEAATTEASAEAETTATADAPTAEATPKRQPLRLAGLGKAELVAKLEELVALPVEQVRDDVSAVKAAFYGLLKEQLAEQREQHVAQGGDPEAFEPGEDDDEKRLKELLADFKVKRDEYNAAQEAVRLQNLEKKKAIIEQINEITGDADNINRQYTRMQQLQQEFKAVGPVPQTDETDIWKTYQQAVETFYDLLKMNKELRDYDFKKNLELKQQLCAEAEQLDELDDVTLAFRKLLALHDTWREIGPVAKELREDLWARFKNASSVIRKKHQAFYEERKANEQESVDAKTALCEQAEAIDLDSLKTLAAWDAATKQVIELQRQWKEVGFVSRKLSNELFARFRQACDAFFARKTEFFKERKEVMAANLSHKQRLCEQAEALKDSTDWRETADALVELQKEWKTIGPVPKRQGDAVWKRFITACDHFFDQRKKTHAGVHAEEHDNLKTKKEIIAQINALLEAENPADDAADQVRQLMDKWQTVGHVPFKEKDKIFADYRAAIDRCFEQFDMKGSRARMASFESNLSRIEGTDKVLHERDRLVRDCERKCNELKTYENNMGFFNARSSTGNSLVKEMERKIERLKEEIAELKQKIKLVDEKA